MTTLIAGCGYVGMALAQQLAQRGERVIAMRRNAVDVVPGVLFLRGDMRDPKALADVAGGIERLVFAASPDSSDESSYRATYVDALSCVLDQLGNLERAVVTSTTSVLAASDGEWADETSAVETSGKSLFVLEGERLVRERVEHGVALRLAGIYGPGRDRLIRAVADGSARTSSSARWTNRIHRDDAAHAIATLLDHEKPAPVYLGVDDAPVDLSDVYAWIASRLGLPEPVRDDEAQAPQRARGANKRLTNERLRGTGWTPRYPSYREGYEGAIAQYIARSA